MGSMNDDESGMSERESRLVAIIRTANARLLEMGLPPCQLATARPARNRSDAYNMWANIREGALRRLVSIRDVPSGAV